MDISVIIVSYNVRYYLAQCLDSLKKALQGLSAEVIVVDNHSHDGTAEEMKQHYPWVRFMALGHNLGFSKANNRGIRESKGRYVLLLNPDTIVGEHVLQDAVSFMDSHPKAGGAGVRMLKADGTDALESRRGVPTPMTAFWKMIGLCQRFPTNHRFAHYYMGWLPWDEPSEIEIISGAFCLLRRQTLNEIGLLDEDFFMYGEDIDLSYRILKGGWQNWYLPLKILHYKGESTQKTSFRYVHVFYEAMLIFFRKHFGHLSRLLAGVVQVGIYLKAAATLFSMQCRQAKKSMGFVKTKEYEEPAYVFHVAPNHEEACRELVEMKGLQARFVTPTDAPEIHRVETTDGLTFHVFDISIYSYENILECFSSSVSQDCQLATWNPESKRLITSSDVYNL